MSKKIKKILCVLGSPRKNGNSSSLAEEMKNGALSAGAAVDTVFLREKNISPCTGCDSCKVPDSKGCVIQDDMQELYKKLTNADAFIFATPVYWAGFSSHFKLFLDRCYGPSSFEPFYTVFTGKKAAAALCYGGPDVFSSGCVDAVRTMKDIFEFVRCESVGFVYGQAHAPGEIKNNKKLMEAAFKLGITLAS